MADQTGNGPGSGYTNPEIPHTLSWNLRCENFDDYKKLVLSIYSTLRTKRATSGETYVTSGFCNLTNAQLRDNIRTANEALL